MCVCVCVCVCVRRRRRARVASRAARARCSLGSLSPPTNGGGGRRANGRLVATRVPRRRDAAARRRMVMGAARPAGASCLFHRHVSWMIYHAATHISRARCCSSEEWRLAKPSQTDSWCCFLSQWALRVVLGRTIASGRRAVGVSAPGCQIQLADGGLGGRIPSGYARGKRVRRLRVASKPAPEPSRLILQPLSCSVWHSCCHQHRVALRLVLSPHAAATRQLLASEKSRRGQIFERAAQSFFCA